MDIVAADKVPFGCVHFEVEDLGVVFAAAWFVENNHFVARIARPLESPNVQRRPRRLHNLDLKQVQVPHVAVAHDVGESDRRLCNVEFPTDSHPTVVVGHLG